MSSLGALPGAVVDDGVLAHLGNPLGEQRALRAGRALAPLGARAVLAVTGEDRLSWLDSISSQSLARLPAGVSTETLVLDPHGHVEHAAGVVDDGESTWLLVDRARSDDLLAWLRRMRFRLRVDPQDRSETHAVVAGTVAAVAALTADAVWHDPWPGVADGGWGYAHAEPHPGAERDWCEAVVSRDELDALAAAAARGERELAGALAADALRVAAWRPAAGEVDGRTLPHEVDWLRTAVHLDKGCYRGQETVAKVHNLGRPPRRLVSLQLDGSDVLLPEPGAEVQAEGETVGRITSAARHFEEGPIALALVTRTLAVDAPLTVVAGDETVAAAQETIVPPDAGRTVAVPRLPRLSRRR
ncbi:CAF17-like 4Fe-4S cluster assembly/insertion protein YgfZ [Microbacterium sp. No. 7]|uniref:CAF17-like 4Fe-4S cluster assembly/insertion protein YgfZ n=1 Tax=Microbacterium sp. No. 7 TaxID=1714373 RepID=UPI0006D0EC59|nr:glycine cleavage T C-terminal barrel domain-containing protein [Microbacterium sp. No. 7]ALJ19628.1 aminomethyltransferase [Microbacterium sp. No. 7]